MPRGFSDVEACMPWTTSPIAVLCNAMFSTPRQRRTDAPVRLPFCEYFMRDDDHEALPRCGTRPDCLRLAIEKRLPLGRIAAGDTGTAILFVVGRRRPAGSLEESADLGLAQRSPS